MSRSRRAFSLLELLISSGLALMILGIGYLLYAGAFQKAVLFSKMSDRYSDFQNLCRLLTNDLKYSSTDAVFWDASQSALAVFPVRNDARDLERNWATRPTAYHFESSSSKLTRFVPYPVVYSSKTPLWPSSSFASYFTANDVQKKSFSDIKSFEFSFGDKSQTFILKGNMLKSDGSETEIVVKKVVCSSI